MTEKCENCKENVIPVKEKLEFFEEIIIDYKCPKCGHTLRSVTLEK